ncbi:hypothetical protein [Mycolicibacterium sp.]|uniref:hypothetical protein n=1 Tax=Mycolicibacterium sp. TaxID=2320850 RepID=UPI003D0D21A8
MHAGVNASDPVGDAGMGGYRAAMHVIEDAAEHSGHSWPAPASHLAGPGGAAAAVVELGPPGRQGDRADVVDGGAGE